MNIQSINNMMLKDWAKNNDIPIETEYRCAHCQEVLKELSVGLYTCENNGCIGYQECFIFGRRATGYFDLRKLDGTIIHRSASYKKLKLIQLRNTWLAERRESVHPMTEVTGIHATI